MGAKGELWLCGGTGETGKTERPCTRLATHNDGPQWASAAARRHCSKMCACGVICLLRSSLPRRAFLDLAAAASLCSRTRPSIQERTCWLISLRFTLSLLFFLEPARSHQQRPCKARHEGREDYPEAFDLRNLSGLVKEKQRHEQDHRCRIGASHKVIVDALRWSEQGKT